MRNGIGPGRRLQGIGFAVAMAVPIFGGGCGTPQLGIGGASPSLDRTGSVPLPPPVSNAAALLAVEPASGPVGTVVTLTGVRLDPRDRVVVSSPILDETDIPVLATTPTAIRVALPDLKLNLPTSLDVRVRRADGNTLGPLPFRLRPGRTWYVATDGDDRNDGGAAAPFRSAKAALRRMSPGDVAYLRAGNYAESIQIEGSGTDGAPLTVSGLPGEDVLVSLPAGVGGDTVSVRGSFVVVDRLRVTNLGMQGAGIGIAADAYHATISHCEVFGAPGQGIMVSGGNNLIAHNHVHHNGTHAAHDHGVYVEGSRNFVHDNVIHDNYAYGVHVYNGWDQTPSGNNTVQYNLVYHNGYGTLIDDPISPSAGIAVALHGENTTIQYNRVCANAQFGIYVIDDQPRAHVIGNVTCDNDRGAIYFSAPGADATAFDNVSYNDEVFALAGGDNVTSDRNTFYTRVDQPRFVWNRRTFSRLEDYQAATRQDRQSRIAAPNFRAGPDTAFDLARAQQYDFCTTLIPALCELPQDPIP